MKFHPVAGATCVGMLLLTGCASSSTQAEESAPAPTDTAGPTVAGDPQLAVTASPSSTPVPAPGITIDFGSMELENAEGYTGTLEGNITVDPFVIAYENAKPGFVDLERPVPMSTVTFTNTTSNRAAPTVSDLRVVAYYSADSGVCQAYATYPQFLDGSIPNMTESEALTERGRSAVLSADHCFVEIAELEAKQGEARVHEVPSSASVTYGLPYNYYGDPLAVVWPGQMDEVPETDAEELVAKLNNPEGVFVYHYGMGYDPSTGKSIDVPEDDYIGDMACPALPQAAVTMETPPTELEYPGSTSPTFLLDTGSLCSTS